MSIWAYKVITSGKGGFATPALLESFLNQLGAEGWEILHFQTQPDNALAFTGLARRPTQRDWTLEDAAAAAARAEVDKLRAEFEAKFKGGIATAGEEKPEAVTADDARSDDGLRRLRDTERDLDADAPDENAEPDEWQALAKEDDLPTFFEAIQPLMRRNQRGEGLSVGVDHLAKKWDISENDVLGALKECGFTIPEDENARPSYVEYDGDLYWVNVNRRGELWINTKEKSRPAFRVVQARPVASEPGEPPREAAPAARPDSASGSESPAPTREAQPAAASRPSESLPQSAPELLQKVRPQMRRNRRGPGGSGSLSFLSRALKCSEADLLAAFGGIGLTLPESPEANPVVVEIGGEEWWLNRDQRGGIWINGQDGKSGKRPASAELRRGEKAESGHSKAEGEKPEAAGHGVAVVPEAAPAAVEAQVPAPRSDSVFTAVRLLLKPTKTGALSGRTDRLAETLGKSAEDFLAALTNLGLKIPEKSREKPVFVEDAGEIFWLNKNSKNELWLNAKASKFAVGEEPASS